ncbi:MAG TPA: TadE/TadG family type IV pilus assembly protein [Pirellulales bacterium]|jgi:Flp pilus assembly protein TadG|nr:TadE/TadG family type IV pilus assembly protein [Pirellulales bacterium]
MKTERRYHDRRGTSAVEFAFIAPLFFLLVIGMIEFSRAMMVQQVLTTASREGARMATLDSTNYSSDPSPTSLVVSAVDQCLAGANVNGSTTTISPALPVGAGQDITVTVSVPYSSVTWIPSPWFLGGTTLTAVSVMRRETTQ